jgi:hypothetical protein
MFDAHKESPLALRVLQLACLLGDEEGADAREFAKEQLQHPRPRYMSGGIETRFFRPLFEHLSGDRSDQELVEAANAPTEFLKAHFQIAMMQLSHGNRDEARTSLAQAAKHFGPWDPDHYLCKAYLRRMESDDDWPNNIPGTNSVNE